MAWRSKPKGPKGGAVDASGRCSECGGVEGRHNKVRVSVPEVNEHRQRTGRYKIEWKKCPAA